MALAELDSRAALKHLRAADPVMAALVRRAGPFQLKLDRNRFKMLARSILAQQISTAAARSIYRRLQALIRPARFTAAAVAALTPMQLRSAGLSQQKAAYLHALAAGVTSKSLRLDRVQHWDDEQIIEHLSAIKGVGRWTAQMFLMFSMGRPDVFPHDDLGVRSALKQLYGLADLPDRQTSLAIAEPWRPFSTVASWYCWRHLEIEKKGAGS